MLENKDFSENENEKENINTEEVTSDVEKTEDNMDQDINFETGEVVSYDPKESIGKTILSNVFDIVEVFSHSIALMVLVFLFVVKFVTVEGTSLVSTLQDDDKLIIYNLFYTPETDDVIVINYKERNELLVKRVIGTEGDTVKIDFDTWEIWVNGEYLEQPYLLKNPECGREEMKKGDLVDVDDENCITFTVEKDKVFVLGDNRNHSSDSRVFGQLDENEIMGKVIFRVQPIESAGVIK